ncbi:MAG: hypothetical protein PHD21_07780 [Flavobacteriales bacterium]|nr:hypothetical protein [Flavobacteriales bacterium]
MKKTVLLVAVMMILYDVSAIIPDREYIRYPYKMSLIYKDLDVKTKDGYDIKTWFFPAQNSYGQNDSSKI